jgi:hypothetical protein
LEHPYLKEEGIQERLFKQPPAGCLETGSLFFFLKISNQQNKRGVELRAKGGDGAIFFQFDDG